MACYVGRHHGPGYAVHLLIGDGHRRVALCGVAAYAGAKAWTYDKLELKAGVRVPVMPVTCKRCLLVLIGRGNSTWDWEELEENS